MEENMTAYELQSQLTELEERLMDMLEIASKFTHIMIPLELDINEVLRQIVRFEVLIMLSKLKGF